jgi:hypothetical protein
MNIIEQELLYQKKKEPDTRFMFKHPGEWGYFTNLHYPTIRTEYETFRKSNSIPSFAPLSDDERHIFDATMMHKYKKEWQKWHDYILMTGGGNDDRQGVIPIRNGLEVCKTDSA